MTQWWQDLRHGVAHLHFRGRDRDRAIEWSEPFEFFDQPLALIGIHAGESKGNRNRIKSPHVGAGLIGAIQDAMDAHRYRSQRDFPLASDRLNQLHAASPDRGKERLGGSYLLTRGVVLYWAVDDEMVTPHATQDTAEDVGRTCSDIVLANLRCGGHTWCVLEAGHGSKPRGLLVLLTWN